MFIELSILFAFLAMLCWGFGDFFIQKSIRKIGDIESLAFIGIIGTIFLLPFAIRDFNHLLTIQNLILLFVLSILVFICALFNFEAFKKGKLSVIDVILEIELPITIALGFIFFKESLSIFQFIIIGFIFIGILLIATKSFEHFKNKLEKGVLYALIAAILMGFVNFLTASSAKNISPFIAIWFPWFILSILCLFLIWKKRNLNKFIKDGFKFKYLILTIGILDTFAWVFYAKATVLEEISIITAITESYTVIGLFLGVLINKEKINWHQYLGGAFAIIASIILAFTI